MNHKLAVFDLDGTLYNGQVWKALAGYLWKQNVNRVATAAYMTRNMSRFLLYKAKLMPREKVWDLFGREIMGMLRGLDTHHIEALADGLYQNHIAPQIDSNLLAEWERFGQQGYQRVILSGSPRALVASIGRALSATAVLGTEGEVRNGRFTGRIAGDLIQGKAKMQRLVDFVAEQGWGVDWTSSHAFGDSYTDLTVLSLVGNPHAVRPDPKLFAHAQSQGWRVWGLT
jgi:HAD superfamily hydrolase (TIGR01490 family)